MRNTMNEGLLRDNLEGGDKEKIRAAVQETLDWMEGKQLADQATNEIDSLFRVHRLLVLVASSTLWGTLHELLLPWAWWR